MNIKEVIKKRKSFRSFNPNIVVNYALLKILTNYIRDNSTSLNGEIINLTIVEKSITDKKMKLDYGTIKGHHIYILGTSDTSNLSKVNYGYLMEKVVLKATDLGLSTCWVGSFDETYFPEVTIEEDRTVPGIVIIGFTDKKIPTMEKLVRLSLKASKRKEWNELFFNYNSDLPLTQKQIKKYAESLEMVRLAPSSGNTQPWRVFYDESAAEYHFFKKTVNKKYEKTGMHYLDLGIALSHFEMTSIQNKLYGNWKFYPNDKIASTEELEYIITWKCNEKLPMPVKNN